MKKTITATVLSAMMALSLTSTVFAKSTFSDVPATHWANTTVEKAVSVELLNGYEDNTFKPENTMSKLEFLSVVGGDLAKRYGYINECLYPPNIDTFIAKFNPPAWAEFDIKRAYNSYIITENDTEFFNYNEPITRAEIAKILRRVEISDEWLDEVAKKTGYGKPDGIRAAYRDYLVKEYRDNTSEEQLEKDYANWNEYGEIDSMIRNRPDIYKYEHTKNIRNACSYYYANLYTGQYTSWEKNAYKWLAEWNLEQITLRMNETLETKPVEANAIADWNAIADENKPAVASVYKAKIVNGYEDGTFKPNNTVTRAEAATMLINAYEYLPKNEYHGSAY